MALYLLEVSLIDGKESDRRADGESCGRADGKTDRVNG